MGIGKATAFLLQELSQQGLLSGKLLQLGVQRISPDAKILVKSFANQEASKSRFDATSSKKQFWHNLGFDFVSSLDNSDFEGAEIVWDLNLPLNDSFVERFDVVFDGGTMEHVFNTKQVLENIGKLLKIGGLAIHEVPSSNSINHGFYSFSPTLFQDYYSKLDYEIIEILLVVKKRYKAKIYQYSPRDRNTEIPENWGNKNVNVWCVARKRSDTVTSDFPQQTKYVNAWSKRDEDCLDISYSRWNRVIIKIKIKTGIFLIRKRSAVVDVLIGFFNPKAKKNITMLLKHEIKSKNGGDV